MDRNFKLKKVTQVNINDIIYYEEDVFFSVKKGKGHVCLGKRIVIGKVIKRSFPGEVILKIMKSAGVNALPAGLEISKPIANLMRGYNLNDINFDNKSNDILEKGGHLEGIDNGRKVVLTDAYKGGMSVGAKHTDDGIKGVVGTEKRRIEFEGEEIILGSGVSDDKRKYDFNGQDLTASEIASELNYLNGGVKFAGKGADLGTESKPIGFRGNEIILTAPVTSDTRLYYFNGKKMTAKQIASELNAINGGVTF